MWILLGLIVGFIIGRRYERKQFYHVGKKRSTQDVLGVFNDNKR